ncbi:hypothetical protein L596_016880 [Steinernema carpocapsae]|uniref:RING-type domain-containing protein n=1 Tax=Steinernema carpocapsae TaxID=34508 RepID=A0A4U5NJD4_STECR|nr:hypothetical protein L596_016880 [Steinernema carpocapsae]
MSTCTSCSEVLSFTSPSLINQCGHIFHESCSLQMFTCPSCLETIANLEKIYFSVSTYNLMNSSADLCKIQERIKELEAKNESLRNATDYDALSDMCSENDDEDDFNLLAAEQLMEAVMDLQRQKNAASTAVVREALTREIDVLIRRFEEQFL